LPGRFDRRALVILGNFANLTYLVLIPLCGNFWSLLGMCVFGGFAGAISMPAASALSVGEGRKFGMGATMSIFNAAFSIGMAIGPLISGLIADLANINSVFYFAAAMGLVGTGLFAWFTR